MLKYLISGLTALTATFSLAGSVTELTTTEPIIDSSPPEGFYIGAPHLEFFTRSQSTTTDLPGYFVAYAGYQHQFASDFDSLPGDVKSDEFSFLAPVLPLNYNDWHLISFLYYTQLEFKTSSPNLLPNTNLHSINLPIAIVKEHGHEWISGAFVMPSWNGDFDAGDNDGIAAGAGLGYVFNPDFRFLVGAYYSHYYGNDFLIPVVQLIYRPCTDVEAYILGPIAGVSYSVNEDCFLGLSARFSSPTWKVKADQYGPERTINVGKVNLAFRAEHRLYKNIWGGIDLGYSFARSLKVEDLNNNTLQESDIKPGPFASISINYRY
ncbi:DUF6268 family outer membrane beta-barrel protein [Rubritalea tangerina]|uniref:DUF6268 family outer membrane beta-barrel protein n=1 Tax=Rubritalea tangerina TaxID=430798 RepID=A0ABW4ZEX9_9BACT